MSFFSGFGDDFFNFDMDHNAGGDHDGFFGGFGDFGFGDMQFESHTTSSRGGEYTPCMLFILVNCRYTMYALASYPGASTWGLKAWARGYVYTCVLV